MTRTAAKNGILIVSMYSAGADQTRLHSWFTGEKLPALTAVPGVTGATVWETAWRYVPGPGGGQLPVEAPPALTAIIELDDVDVVRSAPFLDAVGREFAQTRIVEDAPMDLTIEMSVTCREIARVENPGAANATPARGMMLVSITPERDYVPMLHEWYMDVHLPELLVCPGMLGARRFEALEGIPNFFALYYLDEAEALKSPEFVQISGRPFTQLPEITQRLGPHMRSNICDAFRALD